MPQVSRARMAALVDAAGMSPVHPMRTFLREVEVAAEMEDAELAAEIEDAIFGSAPATDELRRRASRRLSRSDLAAVSLNHDKVGHDGERLVNAHLEGLRAAGILREVTWTSDENAVAPYDFEVVTAQGVRVRVEVKSTEGGFDRTIHLSAAQAAAAEEGIRYDLYRVYGIGGDGAKLRIAENVRAFAKAITAGLNLPPGVRPDCFSVDPASAALAWGGEQTIERPAQPGE